MTNPLLKKKYFFIYLTFWIIASVIQFIFLTNFLNLSNSNAVLDVSVFNIIYIGFGLGFWYSAQFITLEQNSLSVIIFKHLAASSLASFFWSIIGLFIVYSFFNIDIQYKSFLNSILIWRFLIGIFIYGSLVVLYYVIIFYNVLQEKLLRESELNNLKTEAELRALKYQLNPHFIFNSLNSVSSLAISDPEKAREMIIKLSNFLRSTISSSEIRKTRLAEELNTIQLYLDIEKIRFEGKFEFIQEIHDGCLDLQVPHMILQPLFENAIKHGVYESLENVIIRFKCFIENEYLKIIVENDFDSDMPAKKGKKIGLVNIKERLKLIYDQDNLLVTEKLDNLFRAILFIPQSEKKSTNSSENLKSENKYFL